MGKILIIDDDQGVLEAMKAILEFDGHSVSVLGSYNNLDFLKDNYQLILIDYLLSGKDGKLLIKKIKKNPLAKNTPIIMLSAHPDAKKAAFDAGADDFIAKPFEMEELTQKVKIYLNEKSRLSLNLE